MNLLIATGIFPPDIGGPATYSRTLAEALTVNGHRVVVVTYGETLREDASLPFTLVRISRKIPKGVRYARYVSALFRYGRSSDVIFAQDPVSAGIPARLASMICRSPLIMKIVGDYAWEQAVQRFGVSLLLDEFLSARRLPWRARAFMALERMTARGASHIIVPSDYLRRVVMRWGIDSKKITVIPNGTKMMPLSRAENARRGGSYTFLSVGRLVPWKGYALLVDLMRDFPQCALCIVGEGPLKESLEMEITKANVGGRVRLLGRRSMEELHALFKKSDAFLLNTGYEGFSHQIIEAMAAGLPVITTDAGGNREIVHDGENALVASYDNREEWKAALERFLRDEALRGRLSVGAQRTASLYTTERMIQETEKFLCTCI